jgi:hypothetical protein
MDSQRSAVRTLRRLLRLSSTDWLLLLRALPLVATVRCALWLLPFSMLRERVTRVRPVVRDGGVSRFPLERIAWSVRVSSRLVPKGTCLTQALAAQILLKRSGAITDLRLGVARNASGAFEAHAWVECQGKILIGGREQRRFTPLPGLNGGRA